MLIGNNCLNQILFRLGNYKYCQYLIGINTIVYIKVQYFIYISTIFLIALNDAKVHGNFYKTPIHKWSHKPGLKFSSIKTKFVTFSHPPAL